MSQDTREKIMESAKALFSEHGFAAVTTKEIAKTAGISEVTLYRHFESKRSLFNDIVKENMMNFGIESYIENEATYDVRKDLIEISSRIVDTYKKNRALHRMVIKDQFLKSEARTHSKKIENKDMKALYSYFEKIKEKNLVKDDSEKLMKFFISNIHGFVMHNYILKTGTESLDKKRKIEYFDWLINKYIDIILM